MTITRRSFLLSSAAVVAGVALPAMSKASPDNPVIIGIDMGAGETFGYTTALMVTSRETGARMALMVDPGETVDHAFLAAHGLEITHRQGMVVPYSEWIGRR